MTTHLHRSISQPIRESLNWSERWEGPDQGLIWCWERGRQLRVERPELAIRVDEGELVILGWKGGVERRQANRKQSNSKKPGTLKYLAMWQGLRAEDLDLALDDERVIVCTKSGQAVAFSSRLIVDEE